MPLKISRDEIKLWQQKIAGHQCAVCGGVLNIAWGGSHGIDSDIVRCGNDVTHDGIKKTPYINFRREV